MKCTWKEASTVILTSFKLPIMNSKWNYKMLALERSLKSSFMPNGYVFPGGTTHSSDSSKEWLDLFSEFQVNVNEVTRINGKIPPIIKTETGEMAKLLSLKITAIRETFEETGILLCFFKDPQHTFSKLPKYINSWRLKVQNNPSEFFNMCKYYKCCPDVHQLHLWSNWLTPTTTGKIRFDTAFFIACLKKLPAAVADKTEIEKLFWLTPEELLKACKNKKIWLPPPQVYETSRLLQFQDINVLNDFATKRAVQGCERWMPVQIKTVDGSVSMLPGDEGYNITDYCTPTEAPQIEKTNAEFRSQFKIIHRMEFLNKTETKIVVQNYNPSYGHVLPAES